MKIRGEVMKELTKKQKLFADEFLKDLNQTQAAIRAGYSPKTAYSIGNQLLKKLEIKNYVENKLQEIEDEKIADAREVMEYLTTVMRGKSSAEVIAVIGTGEGHSKAVKIKKAPDEKEKLKAAELLGKRFGLFKDKVEIDNTPPVVIKGGDELE